MLLLCACRRVRKPTIASLSCACCSMSACCCSMSCWRVLSSVLAGRLLSACSWSSALRTCSTWCAASVAAFLRASRLVRSSFQLRVSEKICFSSVICIGACVPLNLRIHKSICDIPSLYSSCFCRRVFSKFLCCPSSRLSSLLVRSKASCAFCCACNIPAIYFLRRSSSRLGDDSPKRRRISSRLSLSR